jgi:hypothetical protein
MNKVSDPQELKERSRAILNKSLITNDPEVQEILMNDSENNKFDVPSKAEVHYTGKENIEVFASLFNIFLRSMLLNSENPCLINVDNVEGMN